MDHLIMCTKISLPGLFLLRGWRGGRGRWSSVRTSCTRSQPFPAVSGRSRSRSAAFRSSLQWIVVCRAPLGESPTVWPGPAPCPSSRWCCTTRGHRERRPAGATGQRLRTRAPGQSRDQEPGCRRVLGSGCATLSGSNTSWHIGVSERCIFLWEIVVEVVEKSFMVYQRQLTFQKCYGSE